MVVPVNKVVHVLAIGADVIHAFRGSVVRHQDRRRSPAGINETWFKAEREGTYHGQCSELVRQGSRLHADRQYGW